MPVAQPTTWKEFIDLYPVGNELLFSPVCVQNIGALPWPPLTDDSLAAGKLHTQLISRIATQRLGYLTGTENAALDSVYLLFKEARKITDAHPACRHFELLTWDILNHRVRPFTAKWHRESTRGVLAALDSTDEFRAELADLQRYLRQFDRLLQHLRDKQPPLGGSATELDGQAEQIKQEMSKPLGWRIPKTLGNLSEAEAQKINAAEQTLIADRRKHYGFDPNKPHATALALSGGGIRSATFSLGVLVALARRGILPQIDYLSTVSGGGYIGAFLSSYLHTPDGQSKETIGLRDNESPFHRHAGEGAAFRHLRHHCRYLTASSLRVRWGMVAAQLQGMVINGLGFVLGVALIALIERTLRRDSPACDWATLGTVAAILTLFGLFGTLILLRLGPKFQKHADTLCLGLLVTLGALVTWRGLASAHGWVDRAPSLASDISARIFSSSGWGRGIWLSVLGGIPLVGSALIALFGRVLGRKGILLAALTAIAAPIFFVGVYLAAYHWISDSTTMVSWAGMTFTGNYWPSVAIIVPGVVLYYFVFNVNATAPHRHYRNRLAETFLIQPAKNISAAEPFERGVSVPLSDLAKAPVRGPYHLINCALNVPATEDPRMQGRLTDFFLFSPKYCGSPLTGYLETDSWEKGDPHLDLGTAMAISGAAAAPQMGLGTMKRLRFWLALLNVRLDYWVRRPNVTARRYGGVPGLGFLFREMFGRMDEKRPWLNISDGGHIENLGVYELLRRRCKYIVAVDGEQDRQMTFAALTTLQRHAAIDLGVRIDIDLEDLRLNDAGLSRSHFRFARIHYPPDDTTTEPQYGYLLYVKLSLTGNEGEFIRRYRTDEPIFPHHSTADQFFTEAQFEAYRSLGEHIGDKLFLQALVGNLGASTAVNLEDWFLALGQNLLEPRPAVPATKT